MTDPITLPDFVEDAETKLPGIAEEYSVLQGLARPLLRTDSEFKVSFFAERFSKLWWALCI